MIEAAEALEKPLETADRRRSLRQQSQDVRVERDPRDENHACDRGDDGEDGDECRMPAREDEDRFHRSVPVDRLDLPESRMIASVQLRMHVLLLRPVPDNDRFGLGPFFRIEPLGLEYIAAALEARGHRTTVADLRYSRPLECAAARRRVPRSSASRACTRSRPTTRWRSPPTFAGRMPRRVHPDWRPFGRRLPVAVLRRATSTRSASTDGELVVPALADALERGRRPATRARPAVARRRWRLRQRRRAADRTFALDEVPLPLRRDVDAWRRQYACLLFRPVWLIETARGCPFRCSFCSVWQLHDRDVRLRSIEQRVRRLRRDRSARLRRRRSVLVSARAQPRAGGGARNDAASASAGCSCRAAPISSRTIPSCSRRGGRSRRTSTSSSGSRRPPTRGCTDLVKDTTVDRTRRRRSLSRAARIRRHRQLRDRSRLGRSGLRAAVERSSSSTIWAAPVSRFSRRCRARHISKRCVRGCAP